MVMCFAQLLGYFFCMRRRRMLGSPALLHTHDHLENVELPSNQKPNHICTIILAKYNTCFGSLLGQRIFFHLCFHMKKKGLISAISPLRKQLSSIVVM